MSDYLNINQYCDLSQDYENNSNDCFFEETKDEDVEIKDEDVEINDDEFKALYFSQENKLLYEKIKIPKEQTKTDDKKTIDKTKISKIDLSVIEKKDKINFKKKEEIHENRKIKKVVQKIFNIMKEKKKNTKKGRMTKKLKKNYLGVHNKFSEDNIIRKIKASFLEKSMNYINKLFGNYLKKRGIKKLYRLIQRISPEESRKIRKAENLNFLETPLKKIFSAKLSKKCSLYEPDYNKNQIEELYLQNDAKEVINTLDKPVGELYDKYCKNIKMDGFGTLEDDLKEERIKMEEKQENNIEEYIEKYQLTAINYKQIFNGKKARSSKKK